MTEDEAKRRFKLLMGMRMLGVALATLGVAICAHKLAIPGIVGLVFILVGAFDVLIMPIVMIRRWSKTPPKPPQ